MIWGYQIMAKALIQVPERDRYSTKRGFATGMPLADHVMVPQVMFIRFINLKSCFLSRNSHSAFSVRKLVFGITISLTQRWDVFISRTALGYQKASYEKCLFRMQFSVYIYLCICKKR